MIELEFGRRMRRTARIRYNEPLKVPKKSRSAKRSSLRGFFKMINSLESTSQLKWILTKSAAGLPKFTEREVYRK